MTEVCRKNYLTKLIIIFLTNTFVRGYENAYDLAERRNQYGSDPNNRYYESSERYYNRYQDRDRYTTHNRKPTSVYSSIRSNQDPGFVLSRRPSSVGNGYDNLGNTGIGGGRFRDRDSSRFSEPRRFDDTRRWDSGSGFENRRRITDSFPRTSDSFLRTSDSFPRTSDSFLRTSDSFPRTDSFRNFDDRRSVDSLRDDGRFENRPYLGLSRNSDSLDDRRTFDALREIDTRGVSGKIDEDVFQPRRDDFIVRNNPIGHSNSFQSPVLSRRSDHPEYYAKDYFVRKHPVNEKSVGFEAENSEKNFQTSGGEKENSGVSTIGSYVTSNEDKNQKKTDQGYLDNKEGSNLDVANKEKIGETTRFDKNGGNKSTVRSNRVSKKGHATKGFATHHHKDETGNSTTFFDESSDTGGQSDYQDLEDEFGTRKTMEVLNGKEDGRFFQENGGRSGNFGSGLLKDNKKVEKDVVANDKRFNEEERFGDGQDHVDRGFKAASEYLGGGVWNDH